ncbi:O-methyltransferase [Rasamsonia emersonii CBS 393.64]|uniref:O-methyltransferase n=1 Tax=Rasamsonia emersonii (strain ATCC 16479 / CBS 393.64 / IMI 116815) TaxID=1408163 RepID=A0A0F4YMQ8_RASE3|nr:O-methyltransferase [Rasamsonia emersonii CBS 393.64]KKA19572.1 O-methyltransferase [Rasamsonia emersonii CBS 393.64]
MASSQTPLPPSNPLQGVPAHILSLLARLHKESKAQEAALSNEDFKDRSFDDVMRDKFIALDEDKAQFLFQLCRAINAKTVVEAGTSYGVSTIYLALAVSANVAATGGEGRVTATEYEPTKARKAREYWQECGEVLALTDRDAVWTPMALPTLKLVQPHMRYGAVVIADNTVGAAEGYKDLLNYMRDPDSGFTNLTLPYSRGLEMSVYLPRR